MRNAGVSELKKELEELSPKELVGLCISLAKYKKESKDYLSFLLFEAHDKPAFANDVKAELDAHFEELKKQSNLYYVKKGLRKILRMVVRYCRFLSDDAIAAELHIYFCLSLKKSGIPYWQNKLIVNLMVLEIKKIKALVAKLHPDLQNDFSGDLEKLIEH